MYKFILTDKERFLFFFLLFFNVHFNIILCEGVGLKALCVCFGFKFESCFYSVQHFVSQLHKKV